MVVLKPRVFISHVNNDAAVEAIWKALSLRLGGKFDVLVDRDVLKPGDLWRTEIYSWIGLCDAAVVLISKHALEDPARVWVARETACLIFRRALDPALKIIPVLLDDVTFEKLEANDRFRDLQLKEIQCVKGPNVDAIADALKDLPARSGFPQLSLVASDIEAHLTEWKEPQIKAVLGECDVDLGSWAEREDPYRRLALCLLTMDIGGEASKLPHILGRLHRFNESLLECVKRIFNLLLPGLVELEAVRGIVEEGTKKSDDSTRRPLWINAPSEDIAEYYVWRAFPNVPPQQWKFWSLSCVLGETDSAEEDLITQVEEEIKRVPIPTEARSKDDSYQRNERLERCNRMVNRGYPIFITAEVDRLGADLVNTIMKRYGFATVLLRSEIDANLDVAMAPIRALTPKLTKQDYYRFSDIRSDLDELLDPRPQRRTYR